VVLARKIELMLDNTRTEDYLEAIYHLVQDKGYATTIDISERLLVKPPTVSSKLKDLSLEGYLSYQPYRGMKLTEKGQSVAKAVIEKHSIVMGLLTTLGVDKETAYVDTEGIEHHLHPDTVRRLKKLTAFLMKNRDLVKTILEAKE
jgi:DtxR family manganese transport transcriptional regulator